MVEPPDELAQRAHQVAVRGSLLFHLFLAEALAGDALDREPTVAGTQAWAVDIGPDGYEVVALGGDPIASRIRVGFAADGRALVEDIGHGRPSPRQLALATVRSATAAFAARLDGRHAAVVVPPPRGASVPEALDAYAIRLGEAGAQIVAGAHWRLRVSPDGEVLDAAQATETQAAEPGAGGIRLVHALDLTPSELHVFLSLNHGMAVQIITPRSGVRWDIDGARIERLA